MTLGSKYMFFLALILGGLGMSGLAHAQPTAAANASFDKGISAFGAGNVSGAVDAWTTAAAGGHPMAAYLLGQLYEQGRGVKQSPSLAFQYYERAAAEGQALAAVKVGRIYREGNEELKIERDYEKALASFEIAALQSWPEAQYYLADMYRRGQGVAMDRTESLRWLILSAKKKYAPAMLELSRIYFEGEGVLEDRLKGWTYIELASRYATPEQGASVNDARDTYTKRMKNNEKDEAKKMADQWVVDYIAN